MLFQTKEIQMKTDVEELKSEYMRLFKTYIHREGSEALLENIGFETDFFTAPASTQYHGNVKGGLCFHSINVAKELIRFLYFHGYITKGEEKEAEKLESAYIVALLHDLCKTNFYAWSSRNVKDGSGNWKSIPFIGVDELIPLGHGEKSLFLVMQHMALTEEEALAIRWHMGDYSEANGACSKAFAKSPLALFLHQADERASSICEKTYDYVTEEWK